MSTLDRKNCETPERPVQVSDAGYHLLFEANPLPMWVIDRETLAFLGVNQAAVDCYGYSRE
jgi:PAS domain-containing protein